MIKISIKKWDVFKLLFLKGIMTVAILGQGLLYNVKITQGICVFVTFSYKSPSLRRPVSTFGII